MTFDGHPLAMLLVDLLSPTEISLKSVVGSTGERQLPKLENVY